MNLLSFRSLVEVDKESKMQAPKKGFFSNLFKKEVSKTESSRFLVFYEERLISLKQTTESLRKYGSHFNNKDLEKIQMPKIFWNAKIQSVRELKHLAKIELINYKQVIESSDNP